MLRFDRVLLLHLREQPERAWLQFESDDSESDAESASEHATSSSAVSFSTGPSPSLTLKPHQHSRTRFLLEQFAHAFTQADLVIVPEIFFVRDSEEERRRISAADLVDRLRDSGTTAMHVHPFAAIVEHLEEVLRDGDLVVVMGAGPVWQIGRDLVERGDRTRSAEAGS